MIRLLRKHEQLFKNMNIKDSKRSFSHVRRSEGKFCIKYSLCTSYKIHKAPVIHGLKIHKGNTVCRHCCCGTNLKVYQLYCNCSNSSEAHANNFDEDFYSLNSGCQRSLDIRLEIRDIGHRKAWLTVQDLRREHDEPPVLQDSPSKSWGGNMMGPQFTMTHRPRAEEGTW